MSNAFAPIVRARPNPIFGRPVHQGSPPIDYSPILLLNPFGVRIAPDPLSSDENLVGQRGITPAFGYSAPHPSAGGTLTLLIHALPSAHYEPLRHPSAPGLSLAGVRLIIPDHASGFPVLRALSLCTCCRHYPGAADRRTCRSKIAHPYQPSPIPLSGRPAHRPFRGLLGVYSRCGLHTRAVTKFVTAIRGLQTFRHLHACPGCFRLERSPGGPCTHWKTPPSHGARGERPFQVPQNGQWTTNKRIANGLYRDLVRWTGACLEVLAYWPRRARA